MSHRTNGGHAMDSRFVGRHAELMHVVGPDDTATALGSGDVPVLATPRLLALCEAATVAAVTAVLAPTETTVGVQVELDHLAASLVGDEVRVGARLIAVEGRRLSFEVSAERTADGRPLARGRVTRVLVDRDRFLSSAGA